MFLRLLLYACCLMALPSRAVTIKTMVHGDWENPACWSGGQVPTNPDTILVRHYMVLHQDVMINAPTVLFIENTGTICGDYLLETGCGAGFINYGHMYLNRIKTRLGSNYNIIECKTNIVIAGCSSPTAGFQSVPPNGSVKVWPPVFCKTPDTNWEGGTSIGLPELEDHDLNLFPNPITGQDLSMSTNKYTSYEVTDVAGRLICSGSFKNRVVIPTQGLPAGMYFLKLEGAGTRRIEKILKTD